MNQYHEDDSINEMLSMLDNAHDVFVRKYGKDYPIVDARLEALYLNIVKIVKEES